jgi:hypothetical protein
MPNPSPIVAVFFQPERNLEMLAGIGINVFLGPEVENAKGMAPAALAAKQDSWIRKVAAVGGKCVLKRPIGDLPAHCIGVLLNVDEANGKGILPSTLKVEADALRALYPGVSIWASYAGDKITSANLRKPAELQLLKDYLALADVVTTDNYSANRNATRYPMTWTADAVKTVKAVDPRVKVLPWVEMNDQRLNPPKPEDGVNREPTPDEIKATVDNALAMGADGIGWFATCDSGKYGWGTVGDSYWPLVNRNGASIQPQIDMVASISQSLNPSLPPLPADPVPTPVTPWSPSCSGRWPTPRSGPRPRRISTPCAPRGWSSCRTRFGGC